MTEVTQEIIKELLNYDPETGKLFWKMRDRKWFNSDRSFNTWNSRYGEKEAFTSVDAYGYFCGRIFDKAYKSHRIIWLYMTGKFPHEIDHVNHVRSDNCWSNLRETTHQENGKNTSRRIDNTSGCTGVYWDEQKQKWCAKIATRYFKRFISLEDAVIARKDAEMKHGFHKNHGK